MSHARAQRRARRARLDSNAQSEALTPRPVPLINSAPKTKSQVLSVRMEPTA